jgi:phosphosulfolactate synthase
MAQDHCFEFIELPNRAIKPRTKGLTSVVDHFFHILGKRNLEDFLESAAEYVDLLQLAAATTRFQSPKFVKDKIELLKKYDIAAFPGGLFLELALVQGKVDEFIDEAKELGMTEIEVSDSYLPLTPAQKAKLIKRVAKAGFIVHVEVGKKIPKEPLIAANVIQQVKWFTEAGASRIVLETYELEAILQGKAEEQFSESMQALLEIVHSIGPEKVILEAPLDPRQDITRDFFWWAVEHFGADVNLGNVAPQHVILLEEIRRGTYFTGFGQIVSDIEES